MPQEPTHFTPAFRKAFKRVEVVAAKGDDIITRTTFRDEMLKLGHLERVRNLYRINSKLNNKAVFFQPNPPQEKFLSEFSGRDVVLKCRQVGFTTLSAVRGLDKALFEANAKCLILAHLQITVTTIFQDLVKLSYSHFLRDWGHLYRPTERSASRTELVFSDDGLGRPLDSSMRVLFDGRGKTVNFLHVSEAARVEDDRLLGTLQGVPVNGEVILESTPQGRAGDFHRQWQNWRSMGAQAPYRGFFVPWYEFYPENLDDSKWQFADDTQFTPYETDIMSQHPGITPAHIAWRRWCIESNCQGDSDKFENEYPSNEVDCFFTGESLVFPLGVLKAQSRFIKPPGKQGFLTSGGGTKVDFHNEPKGHTAIWDMPDTTHSYVIGADPSAGVGKDLGAAYVLDQNTGKLVARLWGQLAPDEFADECLKLAYFYNKAWICCESNNHGHVVIHVLKTKGYRNLYRRRVMDEVSGEIGNRFGFQTSNESKIVVTEKLRSALTKGEMIVQDNELLNELTSFTQIASKTGRSVRREASSGAHDDLVMSAAFACEMNSVRQLSYVTNEPMTAVADDGGTDYDPITGCLTG